MLMCVYIYKCCALSWINKICTVINLNYKSFHCEGLFGNPVVTFTHLRNSSETSTQINLFRVIQIRPGTTSPSCRRFEFAYVFAGANHQAGFSPWRAIGWLNTMTKGCNGKQPIAYRVSWTRPVDHASCAEENDSSLHRPTCNLRLSLVWQ